jgi:hypothetical protein
LISRIGVPSSISTPPDVQLDTVAAKQFDGREAKRVRASRRSRRKYTMRPIIGRRCTEQLEPMGAIELPDDDEMREALDVGEPWLKIRQDLEHAIGFVFRAKPPGNLTGVLVRTTHKSNRPRGKHKGQLHFSVSKECKGDADTERSADSGVWLSLSIKKNAHPFRIEWKGISL